MGLQVVGGWGLEGQVVGDGARGTGSWGWD